MNTLSKKEALDYIKETIIPSVKRTKWEEPVSIAAKALEHEIWADAESCETRHVNPVSVDLPELFGRNG